MKIKYCPFLLYFLSLIAISSCNKLKINGNDETENIKSTVSDFSYCYFNYRLDEAMGFCTADARKSVCCYTASNITDEDIKMLREKTGAATCEPGNIMLINDSCAEVECTVDNYYTKNVIGGKGQTMHKSEYIIRLVKSNGKWLVKKVVPRQSGKQHHDRN